MITFLKMLTSIQNAIKVKQKYTYVLYSKLNLNTLKIFKQQGYIKNYNIIKLISNFYYIQIELKYQGFWIKNSVISEIKLISKPSLKIYKKYKNILNYFKLLNKNEGLFIISTSFGLMSHLKALLFKKGGQILCFIN